VSELPKSLARRIDRLARGAHAFHRFAHHPLCGEYAGEIFRIGRRTRICRGCTFALIGFAIGAAAAGISSNRIAIAVSAAALVAWAVASMRILGSGARGPKWLTRALPMSLAGFALVGGARCSGSIGIAAAGAVLVVFAGAFFAYRRRGPNRSPCLNCPERNLAPCRGMREIWRREKAFQRAAGKLIAEVR
jgi:hypothetical protein